MSQRQFTRRQFVALSLLGMLPAACGRAAAPTAAPHATPSPRPTPATLAPGAATPPTPDTRSELDRLVDFIVPGGPPKDGIPAIDAPRFVSATEMDELLEPEDRVFVLDYQGELRVYPQIILVWHEIVNDQIGGERISVTYCPLTGSVVGFRGRSPASEPLTFGTTGMLVNSNLLMYDRQTDSRWPQILGRAIAGSMKGTSLEEIPLIWTSWGAWRSLDTEAPVLSTETGYIRRYGIDPYGSYSDLEAPGYYQSPSVMFPVLNWDDRFHPKEVVIGIKLGESRLAIRKTTALERGVWNLNAGEEPIVAVHDTRLDAVWVFSQRLNGRPVELVSGDTGALVDHDGRTWRRVGLALVGPAGERLPVVPFYDVMWFAWYAYFPHTAVVG